jgi:isochorismate synthase
MSFSSELSHAIKGCLFQGIPFAVWREPNADECQFCANPSFGNGCVDENRRAFAVNLWNSDTLLVIEKEWSVSELLLNIGQMLIKQVDTVVVEAVTTDKADYLNRVNQLIDRLKCRGGKTVYSRLTCGKSEGVDWAKVAGDYFDKYPSTFAYLFYTPTTGAWLGASPELLLRQSADRLSITTMSLAGTRPVDTLDEWDKKNIDEQAMVTDFIADTLRDCGMKVSLSGPNTLKYGSIEHLCTRIEGKSLAEVDFMKLANRLSPTPALAGLPRTEALADIAELELHDRRCYGGFVAVQGDKGLVAYVNLRCVNFDHENWCIYSGGGITAASDAEDEWAESEAKAAVLRNLILRK